jgi:DNA-binding SARP family transcriptional activator
MEERELELGARRQRAVFAMLAMRPNRVVSCPELADGLWGSDPPASVVNGIHIYVPGLRRELEPGRGRRTPGKVLRTSGAGYSLQLGPGQPDAIALADYLTHARAARAAGDLPSAARSLETACPLWQAGALCGIPGPWAGASLTPDGLAAATQAVTHCQLW